MTCPDGLAFDQKGTLYISCYAPNAIYKYENGDLKELIDDWESHTLCNPTNMAFGPEGNLYTANLGRWHISKIPLEETGILV